MSVHIGKGLAMTTSIDLAQLGIEWTRYTSLFDQATGLPSGWGFLFDRIEVALARSHRTGTRVAVLVLDDARLYGEHRFDQVVAALQPQLRAGDSICRIGPLRLAVICSDIERDDEVALLARRMLNDAGVICQLGVALDQPGDTGDQLLARGIRAATDVLSAAD
jgi:GGDEF domain-containing protein